LSDRRVVAPSAPRQLATRAAAPAPPKPKAGPSPSRGRPLVASIPLGWRLADAYLALVLLAQVELYAVAVLWFGHFAGAFEISIAERGLMPLALAAAAPCAIVAGVVVELVRVGERRAARIALAALAGIFAGAVGYGVAAGRHFEGGRRIPFALALGLVAALAAAAIAPRLARAIVPRPGARGAIGLGAVVVAAVIALELTSARVLPRLYPAFHLGLAALTLLVAALGALGWIAVDPAIDAALRRASPRRSLGAARLYRAAIALGLFALGAALAPGAARKLARLDNVRLIYLDHAPLLGRVVELAAELAPPEPLDAAADAAPLASGHSIDLRGRDLLLITVDALRADHVGAYGYARPTTPNLDRLAASGVVFDAAYSPTPHTSYAVTSLMTGKYMRPLVLQGMGGDSETWADHLRRYGFRTAAFYPPAVFFIDAERFESFRDHGLDFEYRKVEFAPASARAAQVEAYLRTVPIDRRVFVWVHLFEPHEPYEAHAEYPFGDRDVDRYDAEIAAADAGIGAVIAAMRAARPEATTIVTADHGEEFSEHGGRYHGTTVYEEQVRVPLVIDAPGLFKPHRVAAPVELVDLLPTVLAGLEIPRPARIRGADLGALLAGTAPPDAPGLAFAETDAQTMLAKGPLRLLCARKIAACALYDVVKDPGETIDLAPARPGDVATLRAELRAMEASHGRYEQRGLRSEGKGWPEALRRGLSGDGDAALDVAALLDDADVAIRRKSAEVLFELGRIDAAAPLRLAMVRDDDDEVKRWSALALTRLGEGAPRARDLLEDSEPRWRRLAALALAEAGDDRGVEILIAWWREGFPAKEKGAIAPPRSKAPIPFERAREIAAAFGKIKARSAVGPLLAALGDVRLRPYLAPALAAIGEEAARPALAEQLEKERYQVARIALAAALVKLGGGPELRLPLVRFLGTPDPLPGGLGFALDAGVLELVGGPRDKDRARLKRFATSGVAVGMVVPKGGNGTGLRVLCRARATDGRAGEIRVGLRAGPPPSKSDHDSLVPADAPALDTARTATLVIPAGDGPTEAFATLPRAVAVRPGEFGDFVVYATQNVALAACAVVPLSDELPPPPPEPWVPSPDPEPAP
jgi:arylsulfatase A-like enzyme